jgi:cell division septum initiation protein DivIVA
MQLERVLDELVRTVKAGHHIPFGSRVMLDEDELIGLIEQARHALPDDLREARRILEERDRLLSEARLEAEGVVHDARRYVEKMADETAVAREAQERAADVVARAERTAREIKQGARDYADSLLAEAASALERVAQVVAQSRQELRTGSGASEAGSARMAGGQ